jgi:hypothetical protein
MGAADITGQQVTVEQSPLAQIDYLYDIGSGSIFGGGRRAQFYEGLSPYGPTVTRSPIQTAPFMPPIRRKRGGIIDANDELLRIIGESK